MWPSYTPEQALFPVAAKSTEELVGCMRRLPT
jgi:hypothetical protein